MSRRYPYVMTRGSLGGRGGFNPKNCNVYVSYSSDEEDDRKSYGRGKKAANSSVSSTAKVEVHAADALEVSHAHRLGENSSYARHLLDDIPQSGLIESAGEESEGSLDFEVGMDEEVVESAVGSDGDLGLDGSSASVSEAGSGLEVVEELGDGQMATVNSDKDVEISEELLASVTSIKGASLDGDPVIMEEEFREVVGVTGDGSQGDHKSVVLGSAVEEDPEEENFSSGPSSAAVEEGNVGNASWSSLFKDNRSCGGGLKLDSVDSEEEEVSLLDDDVEEVEQAWGYCLVGLFAGHFPGRAAVQRVCGSWRVRYRFVIHQSGWLVFRFQTEEDRNCVWKGGPYFMYGRPLILKIMPRFFEFGEEGICEVPVWVNLPCLPLECWTSRALSKIVSKVGRPIATDKLTLSKERVSYARVLVEVDASRDLTRSVRVKLPNGKVREQLILYENEPAFCLKCRVFGHLEYKCLTVKNLVAVSKPSSEIVGEEVSPADEELETRLVGADMRLGQVAAGKPTAQNIVAKERQEALGDSALLSGGAKGGGSDVGRVNVVDVHWLAANPVKRDAAVGKLEAVPGKDCATVKAGAQLVEGAVLDVHRGMLIEASVVENQGATSTVVDGFQQEQPESPPFVTVVTRGMRKAARNKAVAGAGSRGGLRGVSSNLHR